MALVDINWSPSGKELRVFALLQLIFFALVAWALDSRFGQGTAAVGLLCVSSLLFLVGLVWPTMLRPVYVVWMVLVFPIGWTVSHLLMAATFFVLMTPLGIAMRLCGYDPLERKLDANAKTYWKKREPRKDASRYFRQY